MKKSLSIPLILVLLLTSFYSRGQTKQPVKNIILVHGAFVDGSGWKAVYDGLIVKGYKVTIVQHPLTSFEADLAVVREAISAQDGPCILVGHSYGGNLITATGTDNKVAGLVYIAAHAIDSGESPADNGKKYPPAYKSLRKTVNKFDFIDPAIFPADFAGGLPKDQAEFMAHSQVFTADTVFHAKVPLPAWKTKPSWYMVAKADRIINPDLERFYAKRAHSYVVEIAGASHSVYISHPDEVISLIERAAAGVTKK
jgi:pimeloyl-ACP methyl ester carboxylesterase